MIPSRLAKPRRPGRALAGALLGGMLLVQAAAAQPPAATGLPAPDAADTVRTNLWLTEALMAEIVTAAARSLPAPPAAVRLVPGDEDAATELMGTVATRVLRGLGYEIFAAAADTATQAAVELDWTHTVLAVDLVYPDVGRTLGIWRSWIERDLAVTALVEITEADSGRMLLNDRFVRSFGDRVPDDDFSAVNSGIYDFTSAETQESGWQGRIEAIVVVGALAGLIAIYFSNTSD